MISIRLARGTAKYFQQTIRRHALFTQQLHQIIVRLDDRLDNLVCFARGRLFQPLQSLLHINIQLQGPPVYSIS